MVLQLSTSGVYLSLNGVTIPNDGYVLASGIGEENSGLHCNTDRSGCCRASDAAPGHWYRPDGTQVGSFTQEAANAGATRNFFSRSRGAGVVRLNRFGTPPESDRGRFRCEVPSADDNIVTLYVNIGEWFVSLSTARSFTTEYIYEPF